MSERPKRVFPWGKETLYRKKTKSQLDPSKDVRVVKYVPERVGAGYMMVAVETKTGEIEHRAAGYGFEEVPRKEGRYFTQGNPPNRILDKTFNHILDEVDNITR